MKGKKIGIISEIETFNASTTIFIPNEIFSDFPYIDR